MRKHLRWGTWGPGRSLSSQSCGESKPGVRSEALFPLSFVSGRPWTPWAPAAWLLASLGNVQVIQGLSCSRRLCDPRFVSGAGAQEGRPQHASGTGDKASGGPEPLGRGRQATSDLVLVPSPGRRWASCSLSGRQRWTALIPGEPPGRRGSPEPCPQSRAPRALFTLAPQPRFLPSRCRPPCFCGACLTHPRTGLFIFSTFASSVSWKQSLSHGLMSHFKCFYFCVNTISIPSPFVLWKRGIPPRLEFSEITRFPPIEIFLIPLFCGCIIDYILCFYHLTCLLHKVIFPLGLKRTQIALDTFENFKHLSASHVVVVEAVIPQ